METFTEHPAATIAFVIWLTIGVIGLRRDLRTVLPRWFITFVAFLLALQFLNDALGNPTLSELTQQPAPAPVTDDPDTDHI